MSTVEPIVGRILGLDHIQLAMPAGGEDKARTFYSGLLGMTEVAKPDNLAKRGGCWFELGSIKVHMGVERGFTPAQKAHPAFLVDDLSGFLKMLAAHEIEATEDEPISGYHRAYINDPFGNRLELMQKL